MPQTSNVTTGEAEGTVPHAGARIASAVAETRIGKTIIRYVLHRDDDLTLHQGDSESAIVSTSGEVYPLEARGGDRTVARYDMAKAKWRSLALPDPASIFAAWHGAVSLSAYDDATGSSGLRRAQRGAVHAVIAHLTTGSTRPATVVLPTGTGKTETMLTLAVAMTPKRLLVIVPSDSLRTQTARKFERLGLLPELGVVPEGTPRPVVGIVKGGILDESEAADITSKCNVLIATPNAIAAASIAARAKLVENLDAVFFDEAHHIRAESWSRIRQDFTGKTVVQFTATPFREDGQAVGGEFVYIFPLRQAQMDDVFSRIKYRSVFDLLNPDQAIAEAATEALRADLNSGFDHLLMARCANLTRARDIAQLYQAIAADLGVVEIHTGIGAPAQRDALQRVADRSAHIVVCVDMLGEGFDLPELKVAALHDPKRSLGPTLQLVGRFARVKPSVGDATVVVARDERLLDQKLRRLYSEDPDWNHLVQLLSSEAVDEQREVSTFEGRFGADSAIATSSVAPKMSTVVFATTCTEWLPERLTDALPREELVTFPVPVNHIDHVLWYARRRVNAPDWSDAPVSDVIYELWLFYWDERNGLLYVNSSANGSVFEDEAELLCPGARLIKGEPVFRVFGRIQRPVPTNVGVLDIYNRARRFSMHSGSDVTAGFPVAEQATKVQTNIFVTGFSDGERSTAGASIKGRIWSYQAARHIKQWTTWCDYVGSLVTDSSIDVSAIKKNFIQPETLDAWPNDLTALALEWPTDLLLNTSDALRFVAGGTSANLFDVELAIVSQDATTINFSLSSDDWTREFALRLTAEGMRVDQLSGESLLAETGRRTVDAAEFLTRSGLIVLMSADAIVSPPGVLFRSRRDSPRIAAEDIASMDWSGIPLNRESRGPSARADTIQGRVLDDLLQQPQPVVIIDDDGKGEVADLVTMAVEDDTYLDIVLYHCKFATGGKVGRRVGDLYELCGQAMRSSVWRRQPEHMLRRLIRRERNRVKKGRRSGMERGTVQDLVDLMHRLPALQARMQVVLVQPGLSVSEYSDEQAELLGSTQAYLFETSAATMKVLGSP